MNSIKFLLIPSSLQNLLGLLNFLFYSVFLSFIILYLILSNALEFSRIRLNFFDWHFRIYLFHFLRFIINLQSFSKICSLKVLGLCKYSNNVDEVHFGKAYHGQTFCFKFAWFIDWFIIYSYEYWEHRHLFGTAKQ